MRLLISPPLVCLVANVFRMFGPSLNGFNASLIEFICLIIQSPRDQTNCLILNQFNLKFISSPDHYSSEYVWQLIGRRIYCDQTVSIVSLTFTLNFCFSWSYSYIFFSFHLMWVEKDNIWIKWRNDIRYAAMFINLWIRQNNSLLFFFLLPYISMMTIRFDNSLLRFEINIHSSRYRTTVVSNTIYIINAYA